MATSTPDDGQCASNDGEKLPRRSPRFSGELYCEKHYAMKTKRPVRVLSPSSIKKQSGETKTRVFKIEEEDPPRVRVSNDPQAEKKEKRPGRPPKAKKANINDTVRAEKFKKSDIGDGPEAETKKKKKKCGRPSNTKVMEDNDRIGACSVEKQKQEEKATVDAYPSTDVNEKRCERPAKAKSVLNQGVEKQKHKENGNVVASPSMEVNKKRRGRAAKATPVQEMVEEENTEGVAKQKQEENASVVACPLKEVNKKRGGRPAKATPIQEMGEENNKGVDRVMELGQVWAIAANADGFPRSYARIEHIIPIPGLVHVTPLIPQPVLPGEELFNGLGLPSACGVFKPADSTDSIRISAFSHRVQHEGAGRGDSVFKIYPKKGEIWAIYLQWDGLKGSFDYELVEVESNFDEEVGLKVFLLAPVTGMDGVYRRHKLEEGFHLGQTFSKEFMHMFSHQVSASKISVEGEMRWKVSLL